MKQKYFIVILKYIVNIDQIDKFRPEHLEFLDSLYEKGILIISGPNVPRDGGVLIAKVSSKKELLEIIEEDPFKKNNLSLYEVFEFAPNKYLPEFRNIFDGSSS